MPQYVVRGRPRADDEEDLYYDRFTAPLNHPLCYPADPVDTGLIDEEGRSIFRLPEPIGYLPRS
jgi:hypothetical protein